MIIACIDGGLICVPTILFISSCFGGAFAIWLKKKFKWCKKSCDCKCHPHQSPVTILPPLPKRRTRVFFEA